MTHVLLLLLIFCKCLKSLLFKNLTRTLSHILTWLTNAFKALTLLVGQQQR